MADYPDWVMKHKEKGTYVNFVNGKYYLYKAHSERVPGTKKVRRVVPVVDNKSISALPRSFAKQ